jgi:hypothetical protein
MKLTIIPSAEYPSHEIIIVDWIAKQKEFYNQCKSRCTIIQEREKAYQIQLEKSGEQHWIPKSQCEIIKRTEQKLNLFGYK